VIGSVTDVMMPVMPEAPRVRRIDEIPAIPTGDVGYRLVRRELGIEAFGVNAFTADAGVQLIEEHDEAGTSAGHHQELYVIVAGRALFTIDGTDYDAPAGTLVFVPDPRSHRAATATADGTVALVIGGAPGQPYTVSPWESSAAATGLAQAGDPDAAADLMVAAAVEHPKNPAVLYNAACFTALAGRREDALRYIQAAAAIDPANVTKWASGDPDLDPIRDDPNFPA
jgi:mannose-6-phosphate isomerase-like protein (cupin superfamily)